MDDRYRACAEELASTPQVVSRLLQEHTPTTSGWCQAHAVHLVPHPCSIRRLAELAHSYIVLARGRAAGPSA